MLLESFERGEELTNDDWAKLTREHADFLRNCENADLRQLLQLSTGYQQVP